MPKYVLAKLGVCICILTFNAYADVTNQIQDHIATHFPANFTVNETQVAQLAWAFEHDKPTRDMDSHRTVEYKYVEINRALTRLYCARLLRLGNRDAYNQFVRAQLATGVRDPLSFVSFTKLAQHIQNLSMLDYDLLQTAAILSAVSLSKPASELAQGIMDGVPATNKMDFLALTLRNNANIYPLAQQMLQDHTTAKKLLYILFPPQTNFRHMLYTEGGIGMFKYLRTMITHGFIDREGLDLWYAHWIVNIAGFRGHVDSRGSLYLTESVASAMQKLRGLIYEILNHPNFNPLPSYLEYRAQRLGYGNLSTDDRLFMTHLGCLLRLYNAADGQILHKSVQRLSTQQFAAVKKSFYAGLHDPMQNTAQHVPAVFANGLRMTNGDIAQVITQILPAYNKILLLAEQQKITAPLSFDELAATDSVTYLLNNPPSTLRFEIVENGTVLLQSQYRN
ncbi:MAG TPA: hypothetical protein VLG38_08310 [Gammaproteobacteria bacterium]|nr:hypothetical protein [Gammaproteobacteria bacterium]